MQRRSYLFIQKAGRKRSHRQHLVYESYYITHTLRTYDNKVTHCKGNLEIWGSCFYVSELHLQYNWSIHWHSNWEKLWEVITGMNPFIRFWTQSDSSRLVLDCFYPEIILKAKHWLRYRVLKKRHVKTWSKRVGEPLELNVYFQFTVMEKEELGRGDRNQKAGEGKISFKHGLGT